MSYPRYVTKDGKLYEVLDRTQVKNGGLMGGTIIQWMLLDVTTEDEAAPFTVSQAVFETFSHVATEDAEFALVIPVEPPARELDRFRAALDRWGEEAPEWVS